MTSASTPASAVSSAATERIAILGAGKMGGILLQAFLSTGLFQPEQVTATVAHEPRAETLSAQWQVAVTTDNVAAVRDADVVLLGVKPTQVEALVRDIAPALRPGVLILSIAASVCTSAIEAAVEAARESTQGEGTQNGGTQNGENQNGGSPSVIRAMPNTPAKLGAGATALCRGRFVSEDHLALAERLFRTVGRTVVVDEKHMDAVTGLSGSGPAFIYIIVEALAEAGVNVGLPRDIATQLAAQTTFGAAKMVLETGSHPALLKDEVTTPAGCTVDGILELEEGGLRVTLIKAVKRATERARQLAG